MMFCTPPEGHGDLHPPMAFSSKKVAGPTLSRINSVIVLARIEIRSASQRAQIRQTPKSAPKSALGSALRNRGALRSDPESALEGALLIVHHTEKSSRALSGALLRAPRFPRALPRALSGALLGVSLTEPQGADSR